MLFEKITDFVGRHLFSKFRHQKRQIKHEISIISSDCLGGIILHENKMRFNTPTINLYFTANDFIRFVSNLNYYLSLKPVSIISKTDKYPVLLLGDIRLFCVHYHSAEEAIEKWEKRKQRIDKNRIVILMTDRNGFLESDYLAFLKIQYPKILITSSKSYNEYSLYVKWSEGDSVSDLSKYTFFGKRKIFKTQIVKKLNDIYNME